MRNLVDFKNGLRNAKICGIAFLGFAMVANGCKKDIKRNGYASATINGEFWECKEVFAGFQPCNEEILGLLMSGYISGKNWTRSINFPILKSSIDTYPAVPNTFSNSCDREIGTTWLPILDYDILMLQYNAIGSKDDFITIDAYNVNTGEISGRFEVTYKLMDNPRPGHEDTLRVRNGKYNAWIGL